MKELLTKERKKKKGFTLIELIIVLAIIAIIAAIAIPNFAKVRTESKVKADKQSAESIRRITLTLVTDEKVLPEDTFAVTEGTATKGTPFKGTVTDDDLKEYFKEVKKPQQDGKTGYGVSISKAGEVTVTTTP
ncbi:prepilin-type N-terminal cleavage/methylation domain-containing protein [Clostridium algidicarnis]|uniref:prepilin-type N-terminal cleavage/methylation domain-containing protein n=1 Tax=Clostridium algidicarnis TaxID=37659 RepID=UPI0016231BA7|nr:prepilin-type N-terminal cleavage/methylation domain-containing protein [Clostridium algidicarnis]MBB6697841.1 prepilin-type N-terminal cleavage/methylation domain-containing protein [Clostridium algidicarnis]